MFRTVLSLIVVALLIAVNVNAQYQYQPYEYKPYQYQAPTYEYKPYQYQAPTYEYKSYQYQAPTYDPYGLVSAQRAIKEMNYQQTCIMGSYGCNKAPSEYEVMRRRYQYQQGLIELQAYRERERQKFYQNQSKLVKFMEWDPYK